MRSRRALPFATVRRSVQRLGIALVGTIVWFSTDLAPAGLAAEPQKGQVTVTQSLDQRRSQTTVRALSPGELRLSIDVTSKRLTAAEGELTRLDRDLAGSMTATDDLREETSLVADETLKNAIDGYRNSEIPTGFLSGEGLTESMRSTALGSAAVGSDRDNFDQYRTLRKDLEIEEAELLQKQERVLDAELEVDELQTQLHGDLLLFGEVEERRLQDQAKVVSAQASNRAQARGRKQGFFLDTCPVNGKHEFVDSWGWARSGGRRHQGVDMLANRGVELVAPVSGRVEHFNSGLGGLSYRLYGDDGNYFYGTHLNGFAKSGQVNAGDVIGYVGDTGNAAGTPHLHFEIHPGGRNQPAVNPFVDVAAVCSGAIYSS